MRTSFFLILLSTTLLFTSCKKACNCSETWDNDKTYVKNDLVLHDGTCWKSKAQGKGIEPGPWLENGNDIWKECEN